MHHGAGVKSIRIEKDKAGQATGFWKGITSTEGILFEYTVGITSTTSSRSSDTSSEKLNTSLETGWNDAVTAEKKAGGGGYSARLSKIDEKSTSDQEEKTRE